MSNTNPKADAAKPVEPTPAIVAAPPAVLQRVQVTPIRSVRDQLHDEIDRLHDADVGRVMRFVQSLFEIVEA